MENYTGKKSPSFSFSVTLVRDPQKALSFPNPNHLKKDVARTSGQPGYPPAVAFSEETLSPLPVPFPGFLKYSILTQGC